MFGWSNNVGIWKEGSGYRVRYRWDVRNRLAITDVGVSGVFDFSESFLEGFFESTDMVSKRIFLSLVLWGIIAVVILEPFLAICCNNCWRSVGIRFGWEVFDKVSTLLRDLFGK